MDLERAYRETGPKIVGYLVSCGADEATARDVLHDAVERVSRMMEEREPSNLPALLFATARNLFKNRLRDGARLDFVEEVDDDLCAKSPDAGRQSFDARPIDAPYLRRRIKAALAALPPPLRESYTLYQIGGRGAAEIAELTGVTENHVNVRIHRAKLALKKMLSDLKEEM